MKKLVLRLVLFAASTTIATTTAYARDHGHGRDHGRSHHGYQQHHNNHHGGHSYRQPSYGHHHHKHRSNDWDWVAPALIGGAVVYAVTREPEPVVVQQRPPVYVQPQTSIQSGRCSGWIEEEMYDGTIRRTRTCY
jgi:hypothetical protein